MAVSDIDKVGARVVWAIGARDESSTFDRLTTDDRFDDEEIERALIETESELMRDIAESYLPYREDFLAWTAALSSGDLVPNHLGRIEVVEIEPYTGAGTYVTGKSEARENIRLWRENYNTRFDALAHDVNGSNLSGYYCLTNQTIEFTGATARAKVFIYTPDYTTPALQIDDLWDSALVAGAITKLNRVGVPQGLIQQSESQYAQARAMIRQGLSGTPEIHQVQQMER